MPPNAKTLATKLQKPKRCSTADYKTQTFIYKMHTQYCNKAGKTITQDGSGKLLSLIYFKHFKM